MTRLCLLACVVVIVGACATAEDAVQPPPDATAAPSPTSPTTTPITTMTTAAPAQAVSIHLRLDRRVDDAATADFDEVVRETLTDARGWSRAGFSFSFGDDAPYTVVLAEGDVVDDLCRPYDVGGRFSCQNAAVVALNADRWRHATPEWTGDLASYRQMLVNHEVGHLLGQHHPEVQCPGAGEQAPVMAQQSTELDGCGPNPWPLDWEIGCAALHLEPVAPGYEPNPEPLCGPEGQ